MRTRMPAFIIMALLGFSIQANAQPQCPELTRLRGEVQAALKQSRSVPTSERCYIYGRLSNAWGAVAPIRKRQSRVVPHIRRLAR